MKENYLNTKKLLTIGMEHLKFLWKKNFSYHTVDIEKEIRSYLRYDYWTLDEKEQYERLLMFAVKTAQRDFNKAELKLQDLLSWDLYADFRLTTIIYQEFKTLPDVYKMCKGDWLFAEEVILSEDGTKITIKTKTGDFALGITNTTIINGKEYKDFIDDWMCFKLIEQGNKRQT